MGVLESAVLIQSWTLGVTTNHMLNIDVINISKTPRYGQTLMSGRVLALKNGTSFNLKVDCQNEP